MKLCIYLQFIYIGEIGLLSLLIRLTVKLFVLNFVKLPKLNGHCFETEVIKKGLHTEDRADTRRPLGEVPAVGEGRVARVTPRVY